MIAGTLLVKLGSKPARLSLLLALYPGVLIGQPLVLLLLNPLLVPARLESLLLLLERSVLALSEPCDVLPDRRDIPCDLPKLFSSL